MEHLEMFQELKIQKGEAWIGLQNESVMGDWQWSQPGVDKDSAKWAKCEPDGKDIQNCVVLSSLGLHDVRCDIRKPFFCYNGEELLLLFFEHFLFNIHYLFMQ